MEKSGSMSKFMLIYLALMIVSFLIFFLWNSFPWLKSAVNFILNPTFGVILSWNLTWGMFLIVFFITGLSVYIQKITTDQKALKELKQEQKDIQKKMKEFEKQPEKMLEINKELMPITFKIMELTMKGSMYTLIPIIFLFRWFHEYFLLIPEFKFFGFFTWFWFYLIFVLIFSGIWRKILRAA
jgi:uncharacterized membrane protein (DUF106 family)